MNIRLIPTLCAAFCLLALGAFSGCYNNSVSPVGNYTFKNGVDYSQLKTYRIAPFTEEVLKKYPALQAQTGAICKEIGRLMAVAKFKPAAEGAPADLEIKLNFSEMKTNDASVKLDATPEVVGFLMMDIVLRDKVVYRGWSPWGVHMEQFNADTAVAMVQACLNKFPPPYIPPVVPQVPAIRE